MSKEDKKPAVKQAPGNFSASVSPVMFHSRDDFRKQQLENGQAGGSRVVPVTGVRDVVAVASGKGGVGKSTVAYHLARTLVEQGRKVGLVDADIYGPSQAHLCRTGDSLRISGDGAKVIPFEADGMHVISVGNLYPPEGHIAWKGPIVSEAVLQLFHDVEWPDIDTMVVDLPPGTGDVVLTLLENVPLTGAVVVTTPQQIATLDAARGVRMFHELNVPVFGIIENMAYLRCPCCGEEKYPFGRRGGEALASRMHVRFLGRMPLDPALNDGGRLSEESRQVYRQIAVNVGKAVEMERRQRESDGGALDPRRGEKTAPTAPFWSKMLR